jgi:hypothetical protein
MILGLELPPELKKNIKEAAAKAVSRVEQNFTK